jgi:hypothetical protein
MGGVLIARRIWEATMSDAVMSVEYMTRSCLVSSNRDTYFV